jgi:hypothetical protein
MKLMTARRRRARTIKRLHDDRGNQGEHMPDTIELLEAIGRDASLRYASTEDLTHMLEQAQASEALTAAVASGERSRLFEELGHKPMHAPQISQTPGHEDDEPDDDDGDEPRQPPVPDLG